jgi:hypothetical protein
VPPARWAGARPGASSSSNRFRGIAAAGHRGVGRRPALTNGQHAHASQTLRIARRGRACHVGCRNSLRSIPRLR